MVDWFIFVFTNLPQTVEQFFGVINVRNATI